MNYLAASSGIEYFYKEASQQAAGGFFSKWPTSRAVQ
jgi:hypothetical protein